MVQIKSEICNQSWIFGFGLVELENIHNTVKVSEYPISF